MLIVFISNQLFESQLIDFYKVKKCQVCIVYDGKFYSEYTLHCTYFSV